MARSHSKMALFNTDPTKEHGIEIQDTVGGSDERQHKLQLFAVSEAEAESEYKVDFVLTGTD